LRVPAEARTQERAEVTKDWARQRLAAIAAPDLGQRRTKVSDQIAAIKALAEMEGWKAPGEIDSTMTIVVKGGLPDFTENQIRPAE
jgi:hypothetical protein